MQDGAIASFKEFIYINKKGKWKEHFKKNDLSASLAAAVRSKRCISETAASIF